MKKKVLFSLILSLLISSTAWASSLNGEYKGNPIVKVTSNGKELAAEEVPAHIVDGKTMVPLSLLRQLGAEVTWDESTYTVNVKMPGDKPSQPVASEKKVLTSKEIAKLMDRVGTVYTYDAQGNYMGLGSGFMIAPYGFVVTNEHVVRGSAYVIVKINGQSYTSSWKMFDSPESDLHGIAINVDNSGKFLMNVDFPFLSYNTDLPELGDKIYVIGSPQGLENTISEGIISGIRKMNDRFVIQHTADTDHGNSGGVLLNEYGEVIGITSSGYEGTNLDFAIPSMYLEQELDKIKVK